MTPAIWRISRGILPAKGDGDHLNGDQRIGLELVLFHQISLLSVFIGMPEWTPYFLASIWRILLIGLFQNRDADGWAFDDLSQNAGPENGHKIEQGDNDDPQADFVDPFMAKIPLLPIRRFDELLKALEQAPPGIDFIVDHPGLSDRSRRCYSNGNGYKGFHVFDSFQYLIGMMPATLNIYWWYFRITAVTTPPSRSSVLGRMMGYFGFAASR
jgi:hypothetical protein